MAKVITFGELMLRLQPYDYLRFVQADSFEATFGGGEANVSVSLANYGMDSRFVTKLPSHAIGQMAVNSLRKYGVNTEHITRGGDRVGIYFLEKGASTRGSVCIYDRAHSAIAEATEEDFGTEYLDYILSIKTVDSLEEAIRHINRYSTGHSDAILTEDAERAERFLNEVDSACVYVNASTRFTDGFEFGFGAEIGISTQKLHARGPMGLEALTSQKYVIFGNGQVR